MNQHTIEIECSMTIPQLQECQRALDFRQTPHGWRPSEYAMTKGSAQAALKAIAETGKVTLFEIGCLSGELARYVRHSGKFDSPSYEAWAVIRAAISGNPDAKNAVKRARTVDQARTKAAELRDRADLLLAAAAKLDRAAL